jgi:VanZ family protein
MSRIPPDRLALWLSASLAAVIALATLTPVPHMPEAPPGSDKLHHFVAFAALVFPAAAAVPRRLLWLAPLAVAYGGAIELIQPHVGREGEWGDFLANAIGVAIGSAFGLVAHRSLWPRLLGRIGRRSP